VNDDASKMMSGPAGRVLPRPGRRVVRRSLVVARHRGLRPEDVMLMCYPKSGSTESSARTVSDYSTGCDAACG